MLTAGNPEIDVDQLMQRIQEKVRERRAAAAQQAPAERETPLAISRLIARAQDLVPVGAALPPMTRLTGFKRAVAGVVGKSVLRLAEIITRDQRLFNQAAVDAFRALFDAQQAQQQRLEELTRRVEQLEAARK